MDKTIAITLGDPAGIGTEIILKALHKNHLPSNLKPLLIGCRKSIEITYSSLIKKGIKEISNPGEYQIIDIPVEGNFKTGEPNSTTGNASFNWLTYGTELVLEGRAKALVTGPIAKFAWHKAGHFYAGQTERLAEITNSREVSMLFTAKSPNNGWRFNTLLATTHLPISEVAHELTSELIIRKLDALLIFCRKFKQQPRLAIAGLNPHAGEKGQLGKDEIKWLIPAINIWKKKNPLIELNGPIPPDTCWISASNTWNESKNLKDGFDGYLALYHDQGLIPVKLIAFDSAVNTTIGLPFIRTSPDHGTAFDIAGEGKARSNSMIAAIEAAWELSEES